MAKGKIELNVAAGDPDVAYVSLRAHPGKGKSGVVSKQVRLRDLFPDFEGPDIFFDLSDANELIGIEIVG